jgi:hypothetical protein
VAGTVDPFAIAPRVGEPPAKIVSTQVFDRNKKEPISPVILAAIIFGVCILVAVGLYTFLR